LQHLDCSFTPVSDLSPLVALTALQHLVCWSTQVSDLSPLVALTALQHLDCRNTPVSDLSPLVALTALQHLDCSGTQVSDLSPLVTLTALQHLECSGTQVSDLSPLMDLPNLTNIQADSCDLSRTPHEFWDKTSLTWVALYKSSVAGVSYEHLSKHFDENCLPRLRAHLAAERHSGTEVLRESKLFVLGNGRTGKTQLTRRLRGDDFIESKSTHGIAVQGFDLPMPGEAAPYRLNAWDFGGQDIYHGTHALFLKGRAIFVLVWDSKTERETAEYEHEGHRFRNHPLRYWVEYALAHGGPTCPLIIVQNKCDKVEDKEPHPYVPNDLLKQFTFREEVHVSAKLGTRLDHLRSVLCEAVDHLEATQDRKSLGKSWARVRRQIESLPDRQGNFAPEHRLISQGLFAEWCAAAEMISGHEPYLRDYLHNTGALFYKEDLFAGQIVLDHNWALEPIYAVLHRENCLKQLQRNRGRFTLDDLGVWLWNSQGYKAAEQQQFLGMMRDCGICFRYRKAEDGEDEYIAPDMLPPYKDAELQKELRSHWGEGEPDAQQELTFSFLHHALIRTIIAKIGDQAGVFAFYWRGGVYTHEATTNGKLRIEQRLAEGAWQGSILVQAKGARADELLRRTVAFIADASEKLGLSFDRQAEIIRTARPDEPPLQYDKPYDYAISYAHADGADYARELNATLKTNSKNVLFDEECLQRGQRITAFMRNLARGETVFVLLSEAYLRSDFCAYELYHMWLYAQKHPATFHERVKFFVLPGCDVFRTVKRDEYADFWGDRSEQLVEGAVKRARRRQLSGDIEDSEKVLHEFAQNIPGILHRVSDVLWEGDWRAFLDSVDSNTKKAG
jgi:internalin A